MDYALEKGSGAKMHILSLLKIGLGIQKLTGVMCVLTQTAR
jgi:hypothetical protein